MTRLHLFNSLNVSRFLMGNMLLVISYIKYTNIQTPLNTILVSMSCIDLLYLTCVLLPVLLSVYVRGTWIPFYTSSGDADILCVCINNIFTHNQVTSILHVFIIGLRPPGLEFRILCLEDSVISIISPSSGGSPGPV